MLCLTSIPYITLCTCAVISVWNISTVYLLDWPLFYVPPASSHPMLVWISLGMGPTSPWNPATQKIEGPLRCWKYCASEKNTLNVIQIQITLESHLNKWEKLYCIYFQMHGNIFAWTRFSNYPFSSILNIFQNSKITCLMESLNSWLTMQVHRIDNNFFKLIRT